MVSSVVLLGLITITLCDFAHLDYLEYTPRNQEKAVGDQVWLSHGHASSQRLGCSYTPCEAARRNIIGVLHLRGGASHSKLPSCYPLHGEGDTEGRDVGSREDPFSVASVSAAPPSAVGEIERMYMEVLRDNPKEIVVRMPLCCFVALLTLTSQ